jgi:6-pyruvoyl-tetrahydropterin synthase
LKYFQKNNPSAENVAKYIFEKIEPELPENVKLEYISVIEEPLCVAKYSR